MVCWFGFGSDARILVGPRFFSAPFISHAASNSDGSSEICFTTATVIVSECSCHKIQIVAKFELRIKYLGRHQCAKCLRLRLYQVVTSESISWHLCNLL